MLNRIFKTVLLGVFALVITTTFTSCRKAKDTIAVIIVKDGSGNTVPHARVVLHANPLKQSLYSYQNQIDTKINNGSFTNLDSYLKYKLDTIYSPVGQNSEVFLADWSDANGRAEFTLPLEMSLNISVLKIDGNDEYLGANIINVKKEEITTQVVKLLNY